MAPTCSPGRSSSTPRRICASSPAFTGCCAPSTACSPTGWRWGQMQHPFCKNLYDFWGDSLYRTLTAGGEDTLLNLASAEYAKAVRPG
ncbi:MAG: peroxide stress protein YaaA [Flavonifractor plautii]